MTPETFLERFFAEPNTIRPENQPDLIPWCKQLRATPPRWTILPRSDGPSHEVWYALAFSDREFRMLREYLAAFLGPTFSSFDGRRAALSPDDPIESAVAALTSRCYRFELRQNPCVPQPPHERIKLMLNVLRGRRGQRARTLSTGRLLSDLELAIQAGNREEAEAILEQLRREHRLDGLNLLYLEVRILAGLGLWRELLALPDLTELLSARRPAAVTEALMQALYNEKLLTFETAGDAPGAAEHFRGLFPDYPTLFESHLGMRSPEARISLMLRAVTATPTAHELRERLLSSVVDLGDRASFLREVASLRPPARETPAPTLEQRVAEARAAGDFATLFALAPDLPPDRDRALLLQACAEAAPSAETERAFLQAVHDLPVQEREQLIAIPQTAAVMERLDPHPEPLPTLEVTVPPGDWSHWLERLNTEGDFPNAMRLAEQGATEWSIRDLLEQDDEPQRFNRLLGASRPRDVEELLVRCLPYIVGSLTRDPAWPRPTLVHTYQLLMLTLSVEGSGGNDIRVFNRLLGGVLDLGLPADRYREMEELLEVLITRLGSPSTVDPILDSIEILATRPCPDEPGRAELCQTVLQVFHRNATRVQFTQVELLRDLLHEISLEHLAAELPLPAESATTQSNRSPFGWLKDRTVAIYTLVENAGKRVQRLLEAHAKGVRVQLLHDHVASVRLKEAARTADFFVIATDCAKHAATGEIERVRPPQAPRAYTTGKGSSSILTALLAMAG